MSEDTRWVLEMERQFDERAELRERVKHNADMYRRDMQYAVDLFDDVLAGHITMVRARNDLRAAHQAGRGELRDWRIGEATDD
jgi:hypothetical protein